MSGHPNTQLLRSFFSKVDLVDENGCWIWGSAKSAGKWAMFKGTGAYRWTYQWFVGSIQSGFDVDHLCSNPSCVNPAHLDSVTRRENVQRMVVRRGWDTHCKRGHLRTPDTYRQNGSRFACYVCLRANAKANRLQRAIEHKRLAEAEIERLYRKAVEKR